MSTAELLSTASAIDRRASSTNKKITRIGESRFHNMHAYVHPLPFSFRARAHTHTHTLYTHITPENQDIEIVTSMGTLDSANPRRL
jgi:hypothetical protein